MVQRKDEKKASMQLHYDQVENALEAGYTDEQLGRLFRAFARFELYGEIPDITPQDPLYFAYRTFQSMLERNHTAWKETCEKNRENARKGWERRSKVPQEDKELLDADAKRERERQELAERGLGYIGYKE